MTQTPAIRQFDLVSASKEHLIAVSFPKTRCATYDAAVNVAKQATQYDEHVIGKSLYHYAAFAKTREQALKAFSVLRYLGTIKGLEVYAGGKLFQKRTDFDRVLECYTEASACDNPAAHCHVMVPVDHLKQIFPSSSSYVFSLSEFTKPQDQQVEFPCRYLRLRNFRFQPGHSASQAEQFQAGAVRYGCDWCPNLEIPSQDIV
jgi:hypothetical protein